MHKKITKYPAITMFLSFIDFTLKFFITRILALFVLCVVCLFTFVCAIVIPKKTVLMAYDIFNKSESSNIAGGL